MSDFTIWHFLKCNSQWWKVFRKPPFAAWWSQIWMWYLSKNLLSETWMEHAQKTASTKVRTTIVQSLSEEIYRPQRIKTVINCTMYLTEIILINNWYLFQSYHKSPQWRKTLSMQILFKGIFRTKRERKTWKGGSWRYQRTFLQILLQEICMDEFFKISRKDPQWRKTFHMWHLHPSIF